MSIESTKIKHYQHILSVQAKLNRIAAELINRGNVHDRSKLESPEAEGFANAEDLSALEYNSPEYNANLKKLNETLEHHYANNNHHPQHFKNGVDDMNLLDVIEMLCDWVDSSKRNKNGNLRKSIEDNGNRFKMCPQLIQILENTIPIIEDVK